MSLRKRTIARLLSRHETFPPLSIQKHTASEMQRGLRSPPAPPCQSRAGRSRVRWSKHLTPFHSNIRSYQGETVSVGCNRRRFFPVPLAETHRKGPVRAFPPHPNDADVGMQQTTDRKEPRT